MYLFVSGLIGAVFDVSYRRAIEAGDRRIAKIINTLLTMEEAPRGSTKKSMCSGR